MIDVQMLPIPYTMSCDAAIFSSTAGLIAGLIKWRSSLTYQMRLREEAGREGERKRKRLGEERRRV
jgi:hypothetical protein